MVHMLQTRVNCPLQIRLYQIKVLLLKSAN